ncbi:type II secretion system F family protein [Fimbriiglobus ruber]|uniref:Type II/IV secretion system protein TadC, associated with Flp pilus assembly n=1 Tax=Fimbriiglobus ruber TaxID=1908690 RepID=A0A225DSW8_9BACT|nr:type II secretion system F family protein [Fimbriiglobus ruber]OWK41638.1 Type II/IV secretion system protein TadC, associated with Flp pilus assembly [Fimbriiglobus ruber]
MDLFALVSADDLLPVVVFVGFMAGTFWLLSAISNRNSQAEDRLDRIGRPKSLVDLEMSQAESRNRFAGLKDAITSLGASMEPQSELEKNSLRVKLANAGFRSEAAPGIFLGIRVFCLGCAVPGLIFVYCMFGFSSMGLLLLAGVLGLGLYFPVIGLNHLKKTRQMEIFLTLPDGLDLLVVCVESGLGLDAAMRKVTDEMKGHAKVLTEEFALANLQLQMGRPRREVLHDLGVRTGVDDVRSLAAILIQADRFGSSIAQALRVQSDSMRVRRRQIAEEKAAKTAVKLIFPLVLFIFPAIFVVLCGPAAIQIQRNLLKG